MLDYLKQETNVAYTENGARAFKTTYSALLDFFAQAGAYRARSESEIVSAFTKAFVEDKLLATKAVFYFRDVRGGQGERRTFRVILRYLAEAHPEVVRKNLHLIAEYGRWDDVLVLLDTPVQDEALALIAEQLKYDLQAEHPSLLAKWLPSENASSYKTKQMATKVRKSLGMTERQYRKSLSSLRQKINIIETKLTKRDYESIDYSKLPSGAGLKYRKAFYRNDGERYTAFLQSVKKGEKKINSSTLFPYEIVRRVRQAPWGKYNYDASLDAMWDALPDYFEGNYENSLCVVDTSGSMWGNPLDVAVSLGLYTAERNKGIFHNHFMTFSARPQLQEIKGSTLAEKVLNLDHSEWGMNTNIESVFNLILDTAVKNGISQDEMVKRVYIISDMEFDHCVYGGKNEALFETIRNKYQRAGYEMPSLVFWNVNARNTQFPMTMTHTGVQLVSGCSPSIFTNLLKGAHLTAYDLMLEVLDSERYSPITV